MSENLVLDIFASWYTFLAILLLAVAIITAPTIFYRLKHMNKE